MTLFVSGVGAAVTQIEDDEGRRLYTSDKLHRSRGDLGTSRDRRLPGVAPWPWPGGLAGKLPGELYFLERPPGSSPLTVSVRGDEYRLMHLSSDHLIEVTAGRTAAKPKDRIRLEGSRDGDQSVTVSTGAPRRRFDFHHLRCGMPGSWRSVRVPSVLVTSDHLKVHAPVKLDTVEISDTTRSRDIDVELRGYDGGRLAKRTLTQQRVPAGHVLHMAPDWGSLARASVGRALTRTESSTGMPSKSRR